LHRAGFQVTGVDINNQPRYPFSFRQANALDYPFDGFDFIWASPICQKHTLLHFLHRERQYPDLISPIRERLRQSSVPWVIENVPNAPLPKGALILCGTMFSLTTSDGSGELRRHRIFECSGGAPLLTPECRHSRPTVRVFGTHGGIHCLNQHERRVVRVHGHTGGKARGITMFAVAQWKEAMGIDWMLGSELSQAIPPAYSEFIGRQAIAAMESESC
jgi:DNA (cytosine-5)-methyltransferase 1